MWAKVRIFMYICTMEKRVAVTGLGVISCIGTDVDSFWNSLKNGICGIDYIDEFPTDGLTVKIGGKVKNFDPLQHGIDRQFIRKQDIFTIYGVAAAMEAMDDSALAVGTDIDPYRISVYMSTGCGGFTTINREVEKMVEDPTGHFVSPNFIPTMIGNMAAGQISIRFGIHGSSMNIATACASSAHAIGEAYRSIRNGYNDVVIAGGTECCTIPIGLAGFSNAKALTRAEDPKYASLPFNSRRSGFVMADGAAVLILEEYEHAVARGARIHAEMVGYGSTSDAYHATAPCPDGTPQAECIRMALSQSGFRPGCDCVYLNAHGTGTLLNDVVETRAIKLAMGDSAYRCHVSSTKSMHGHMLGATGAAEAVATILALKNGTVPPTINLDSPDPECDLDYTPNKAQKAALSLGLSSNFGFGGHNACLAFRNPLP